MKVRMLIALVAIVLIASGPALGHPHFSKTLTAKSQGGATLEVTYFTLPYNEANLSQVKEGFVFITGGATLKISGGSISSNGHTFGPGEYAVRARAKSLDSWEVILANKADTGAQGQDMSKAVSVESETHTGTAEGGHLTLDITGGHGEKDGKLVMWVWFGPRVVEATFSMS